jgi:hypothetical protein
MTRETIVQSLLDENDELVIELANGRRIYSGYQDRDDPRGLIAGDYLRLTDSEGHELLLCDGSELTDPERGRAVLNDFLIACVYGIPAKPLADLG